MPAKFAQDSRNRRSIRLKNYDYSASGYYFVTICVQHRACLFGQIINGCLKPNTAGQMISQLWTDLPARFPRVSLDEFVVMPNHFHGIITLQNSVGAPLVGALDNLGSNSINPNRVGAPLVGALDNPDRDLTKQFNQFQNHCAEGIACGTNDRRAGTSPAPTGGTPLGDVIGAFKSITTHAYIQGVHCHGWEPFEKRFWQRNYYEHIIRNQTTLKKLREYIHFNPQRWEEDQLNPNVASKE